MKLNPDCIRDILLFVEENVNNDILYISEENYKDFGHISKYTYEEIEYHTQQVAMYGFLSKFKNDLSEGFIFHMLSPTGHEFLENIRNEENWKQTKGVAKHAGSFSLNVLSNIASEVVSSAVTAFLLK